MGNVYVHEMRYLVFGTNSIESTIFVFAKYFFSTILPQIYISVDGIQRGLLLHYATT